jgi:hypothetical protein
LLLPGTEAGDPLLASPASVPSLYFASKGPKSSRFYVFQGYNPYRVEL